MDSSYNASYNGDAGSHVKDFVKLAEATLIIHALLYGMETTVSHLRCNEIASFVACFSAVFSLSFCGTSVREVHKDEFRNGTFTKGGRVITFADGRPPIDNIAIGQAALAQALQALRQLRPQPERLTHVNDGPKREGRHDK